MITGLGRVFVYCWRCCSLTIFYTVPLVNLMNNLFIFYLGLLLSLGMTLSFLSQVTLYGWIVHVC